MIKKKKAKWIIISILLLIFLIAIAIFVNAFFIAKPQIYIDNKTIVKSLVGEAAKATVPPNFLNDGSVEKVLRLLDSKVPEISVYGEKAAKSGSTIIEKIVGFPDLKADQNTEQFFQVFVGASTVTEFRGITTAVKWKTFYVNKNIDTVWVLDDVSTKLLSLEKWRNG
ncbi:MAG: hypothetical protein WCQ41_00465 [Bacillota bacterium]